MDKVRRGQEEKQALRRQSGYWTRCPSCGRGVVKKAFLKSGCYVCGAGPDTPGEHRSPLAYKIPCPGCGRPVVRESMERTGCYLCGFSPEETGKGNPHGH
ncbi:hypothetical protein [Desulfoluna butyratoxydans]|uniref:Uncharacterized protein n=1 Tax=Desulfoluna butyratoxydans TaxID=231438 RepID=A0A4U8YHM7_9BACT|nr:hypothetical protein [Desulfoluna butyratoxydans]VFQ43061.1 hypothetical protein MSL71_6880 [Desulfoluna butyratoxydans]